MKTMNDAVNDLMKVVEPLDLPESKKHEIYAKAWDISSASIEETQRIINKIFDKQEAKTKEE